jgi:hypothetical protein
MMNQPNSGRADHMRSEGLSTFAVAESRTERLLLTHMVVLPEIMRPNSGTNLPVCCYFVLRLWDTRIPSHRNLHFVVIQRRAPETGDSRALIKVDCAEFQHS